MRYSVRLSDDAKQDLQGISPRAKGEFKKVFRRLRSGTDPDLDLRLEDTDGLWRAYAGRRWRVIFEVMPGREIVIRRIRRRGDVYEGIEHPHRRDVRESEASYEAASPPTSSAELPSSRSAVRYLEATEGSAMPTNAAATKTLTRFRLPEPPERNPDEVTSIRYVHAIGNSLHLARHFGAPETTIVSAELYLVAHRGYRPRRVPDLLIAFNVDPDFYYEQNGYVIADQGKPPDFILEVASPSTATVDTIDKRREYAELGVREYWRFDHTGESHGTRLAGDRLVDGRYEPIEITELAPQVLQGESAALSLYLRWDHGELGWIDPTTGRHIPTFDDEREARLAAEARVRELEAELRQRER